MLYRYDTFDLQADGIDQTYTVHVAIPEYGVERGSTFPVVYILDADATFGFAASTMLYSSNDLLEPGISRAIVVGIGYKNPHQMGILRVRDMTPVDSIDEWFAQQYEHSPHKRVAEHGGADAFLSFIQDELHSEIERRYPTDGTTCALMGHSFGGLFALYAFIRQSNLFDRYWIGSPGIIGRGRYLFADLNEVLTEGLNRPIRVCMTLGERERTDLISGSPHVQMYQEVAASYDAINELYSRTSNDNLDYLSHEFRDETHSGVIASALNRAYRFLMRS